MVEIRLDPRDPQFPRQCPTLQDVKQRLASQGLLSTFPEFEAGTLPDHPTDRFAELLGQLTLRLQQIAGHPVEWLNVRKSRFADWRILVLVEHAHADVGMAALQLAALLLGPQHAAFGGQFSRFLAFAQARVLPADTSALARAAKRRGIPILYPSRPPLENAMRVPGQKPGMGVLQLGQGARSQTLQGTFNLTRADANLFDLRDDPGQLRSLLSRLIPSSGQPMDEKRQRYRLFGVGNGLSMTLTCISDSWHSVSEVHAFWDELFADLLKHTEGQAVLLEVLSAGLALEPQAGTVQIEDVRLGPDLSFLRQKDDETLLDQAAEALMDSLFADAGEARIPVIAVTGTNGKTTTTRMIAHILRQAGLKTGLVTSEGVNLNGRQIVNEDSGSFLGHTRVLTEPTVEAAALETHHRGIVVRGFAFDDCDVGLCLNVSPDHIARGEIETMAEMEDIKAAVPERASKAAILFADNPHCRAMATRMRARTTWWVSLAQSADQLARLPASGERAFCTVVNEDGAEWITVQHNGSAYTLMPVNDLPVAFGGAARFMVSNAMHAAAATLAVGIAPDIVAKALTSFEAGEDMTPGRLNEIQGLPFRLILDFAHNPDGMAKLVEFTDRLNVSGRKLIALSGMGKRDDAISEQTARTAAGHFDHYFCKEYTPSQPPLKRAFAPLMQRALIDAGVKPENTSLMTYGKQVLFDILSQCAPGDLLVYLIGNQEKAVIRGYIDEFHRAGR